MLRVLLLTENGPITAVSGLPAEHTRADAHSLNLICLSAECLLE